MLTVCTFITKSVRYDVIVLSRVLVSISFLSSRMLKDETVLYPEGKNLHNVCAVLCNPRGGAHIYKYI